MDKYPDEIEAFLAEARAADQPDATDRGRIHRALGKTLAHHGFNAPAAPIPEAAPHASGSGHAPAPASTLTLVARVGLLAVAAGALFGAVAYFGSKEPAVKAPQPEAAPVAAAAAPAPAPIAPVVPAPIAASDEHPVSPAVPAAMPAPVVERTPSRSRAVLAASGSTNDRDGLAEEIALIATARSELEGGKPAAALEALAQHARRFARGALSDERRGLRVLSLCRLGRVAEAADARERFLQSSRNALLAAQVRAACPAAAER